MGKKRRGRERLVTCANCGRSVPRDKAVEDFKRPRYSTDLKGEENVTYVGIVKVHYCISCAKHGRIFERKKRRAQRRREREMYG